MSLDKGPAVTVPCPVCDGAGRWHKRDGSVCLTESCGLESMTCPYCHGNRRVIPVWRHL